MEPCYPHKKPEDGRWRKSTLFSIGGWMSSWYGLIGEECGTAFGGYFRFDEETGLIDGEIIDTFGAAKVEGMLDFQKGELSFQKFYLHRAVPQAAKDIIHYRFTTSEVGENVLWKGGFTITNTGTRGKAECKITPVVENAFALVIGPVHRH